MADNLIFPIGFDLEAGLQNAEGEARNVLDRLNRMINAKPLEIGVRFNAEEILDADGKLKHAKGSINAINHELKELADSWNKLAQANRIKSPAEGEYTDKAKKLLQRYAELTAATESYARSLSQVYAAEKRTRTEQIKAAEKAAREQERVAAQQAKAAEKAAVSGVKAFEEAMKYVRALNAQETALDAINQKLAIYQKAIKQQQIGSSEWNTSALQIRRLTEELQKATQQMNDFQQKSFSGLSDSLTKGKVEALTQYREQLRQLDAEFNKLHQTGAAYGTDGRLTSDASKVLQKRAEIEKKINQMLITAADAQAKREKDINQILEQRKAKLDAIAAKRKAEQQAIQQNIAKLKQERQILVQKENTLNNIAAKLRVQQERLGNTDINSKQFQKITQEIQRLTQKLQQAKGQVDSFSTAEQKVERVSNAFKRQDGYVSRLIKRLAVYASFSAVGNFLRSVREVTAQFELQRVSLGAIIQDQQRANQLFEEIKTFALKSPLSVLDLTKYTKQLAAYKIGTEELFGTTKRLADISVGLGVSMDRVVLAYGQARATGYLRASEAKQMTEMGIPIVEELARKLSQVNGELVTAGSVMDMMSKRQISFEMVKEVFEDMTSAGGAFYNMQEKQANTLYGMWAKLGDAASIMYEEIGNTGMVNIGMKATIQALTDLMNHWRGVGSILSTALIGFGAYKAMLYATIPALGLYGKGVKGAVLAEKAHEATVLRKTALFTKLTAAQQTQLANTKALTQAEWERIIVEKKLNSASAIKLARLAKEDVALKKALISQKLYTAEQLRSIQSMNKMQYAWARTKAGLMGLGNTLKSFLPILAITSGLELLYGWAESLVAQNEAVEKVNNRYHELDDTIKRIAARYLEIQSAVKSASQTEEEFARVSYNDKLKQLAEINKILANYGMGNLIDPFAMTPDNIDGVISSWINKFKKVNEVSRIWGSQLAQVANEFEGNFLGISLAGENLNEDMKDLTRSFTKMANNADFSQSLNQMRASLDLMKERDRATYDAISKELKGDATLALAQKKRNETELQYQKRIYEAYRKIHLEMKNMSADDLLFYGLPQFDAVDAKDVVDDFNSELKEVMNEINKTIGSLSGEDALTIKMAIDEQFALNNWAEWQKEAVINELNKDRLKLGLELIPYYPEDSEDTYKMSGVRAIISTEFKGLIPDSDLAKMTSYSQIVDAIKTKYDDAVKSAKKALTYQVDMNISSEAYEKGLKRIEVITKEIERINQLRAEKEAILARIANEQMQEGDIARQLEIETELLKLGESNLLAKQEEIKAIAERNKMAREGIEIEQKATQEEAKRAKQALDRLTTLNLSDIATDVQKAFSDLIVDPIEVEINPSYSKEFLISDDELEKIANVGDLYDTWAKNTKAIAEEQKKLTNVGISQATIEREKVRLAEEQNKLNAQLVEVEAELNAFKYSGLMNQMQLLLAERANATTAEQIAEAERKRAEFLADTANSEFAILWMKKEELQGSLLLANNAQKAQAENEAYLQSLENAKKLWEELGKRYNFKLFDKNGKGGGGEDPWIILIKNRMKFMQDFQKGVEDLSKFMGDKQGLSTEQENMLGRGLSLKIDTKDLDGSKGELIKWYEDTIKEVQAKIGELGGKEWEGLGVQMILGKDTKSKVIKKYQELLQELFKNLTDFRTDQMEKEFSEKLKRLAEKVSKTKIAKEFYDKVLAQTGDANLAEKIAEGIYGTSGTELFDAMVAQIQEAFKSDNVQVSLDVATAIDTKNQRINYKKLADIYNKYQSELVEKNGETAKKIVEEGQKTTAANILNWQKELAKAQDYEEKRTEIIRKAHEQRLAIIKDTPDEEERARLLALSRDKEDKDLSKLDFTQFTGSENYIKIFQNLDEISTNTLRKMREELQKYIDTDKNLSPENMKTLVKAMEDIDNQIEGRGIGNEMISAIKEYMDAVRAEQEARRELAEAQAQWEMEKPTLEAEVKTAQAEYDASDADVADKEQELLNIKQLLAELRSQEIIDETLLASLSNQETEASNALVESQKKRENSAQKLKTATDKQAKAWGKVEIAQDKIDDAQNKQRKALAKFNNDLAASAALFDMMAGALTEVKDLLGILSESAAGLAFDSAIKGLQTMSQAMNLIITLQTIFNIVSNSNPWLLLASAIILAVQALAMFISGSKMRKANKIIEQQKELVEQLEYSYKRLEKAIEQAFGQEFIKNYNQQLDNLKAQQLAYQRMAEAERSKGKKEDKEKTKEYLDKAQEIADEIADMKADLASQVLGDDLASSARAFAEAWIEAKLSFSNTKDEIIKEFDDMIKTLVVNQALGQIAKTALQPMFDELNELAKDDELSSQDIADVIGMIPDITQSMINGFEVGAAQLKKAGFDIMSIGEKGEYSGIAKEISGATSEEINNAAAIGNSLLFHVSGISRIDENVMAIRRMMELGAGIEVTDTASGGDATDRQNKAMAHYAEIEANTAETVVQLRNIAGYLQRVLTTHNGVSGITTYVRKT